MSLEKLLSLEAQEGIRRDILEMVSGPDIERSPEMKRALSNMKFKKSTLMQARELENSLSNKGVVLTSTEINGIIASLYSSLSHALKRKSDVANESVSNFLLQKRP